MTCTCVGTGNFKSLVAPFFIIVTYGFIYFQRRIMELVTTGLIEFEATAAKGHRATSVNYSVRSTFF